MLELELDRFEATLRPELRGHLAECARRHAEQAPLPPPPPDVTSTASATLVRRALGLRHERYRRSWLVAVALAHVEQAPEVVAARRTVSDWPSQRGLAVARQRASARWFDRDFLTLIHTLHGTSNLGSPPTVSTTAATSARADAAAPPITEALVRSLWEALAAGDHHGTCRLDVTVGSPTAAAWTYVIEPGRHVAVLVPGGCSVTAWSRVMHELGHARLGAAGIVLPRVLDEAAAIATARLLGNPLWIAPLLDLGDAAAQALAATARELLDDQAVLASELAQLEAELHAPHGAATATFAPPVAFSEDPAAQQTYVDANRWSTRIALVLAQPRAMWVPQLATLVEDLP